MKKRVLNDIKRQPLVDKTNILQMLGTNAVSKAFRKRSVNQNAQVDKIVPYSKSTLKCQENAQLKVLLTRHKDISFENNILTKRVKKKPSLCPCCAGESSVISTNEESNDQNTSKVVASKKSIEQINSANKSIGTNKCHDPKFNLQCIVKLKRVNFQEFVNKSNTSGMNNCQQKRDSPIVLKSVSKIPDKVMSRDQFPHVRKLPEQPVDGSRKISMTVTAKSLRQQIKPNYAEITMNTSEEQTLPNTKQISTTRVPVYRQKLDDVKTKRTDKLYEFDESDSDRSREQGKGRLTKKSKLDNSLYSVPQKRNIKKVRAHVSQKNKCSKIKRPVKKYTDIMQEIMQKVLKKVNYEPKSVTEGVVQPVRNIESDKAATALKSKTNLPQDNNTISNTVNLSEIHRNTHKIGDVNQSSKNISTVDINKVMLNISSDNVDIVDNLSINENEGKNGLQDNKNRFEMTKDLDKIDGESDFEVETEYRTQSATDDPMDGNKENIPPGHNISPVHLYPSEAEYETQSTAHGPTDPNNENTPPKHTISPVDPYHSGDIIDESFDDDNYGDNGNISDPEENQDESFLEFLGNVHSTPVKNTSKVNIISDIVLQEKVNNEQPLRDHRRLSFKNNPWRFNQNVIRNPHFIIIKQSSLPCLKQDMVLDHNQIEKIEEHFSKTPKRIDTPRRSPVQQSILNYVNSPDCHNKENIPRPSLFDYDDFSPIKTKSPQRDKLKDKAKRNILGPIQDNTTNIVPFTSTPTEKATAFRRPFISQEEDKEIATYFGFDDGDDVTDDTLSKDKRKLSEAKPFRIKGYVGKKQTKHVPDVEMVEEDPLVLVHHQEGLVPPSQEIDESQVASHDMEFQLFDDPEQAFSLTVPSKIYQKKPRRKRLKSVEMNDEEEHHPKKRKKDMMTKAEEAALEDWAANFNAMCQEVEKHDLEIE